MLTVTTPATTFDLTTLAAVKSELGYTDTNEPRDVQLTAWMRQASGVIAAHCNRVFARETVSETFRLKSYTYELFLARTPVVSIESIVECDTTLDADQFEIDTATGILLRLCDDRQTQWRGTVTVSYVAGYGLLGDLPYGIERAVIVLVKSYAMGSGRDPLVRSVAVEGISSRTYQDYDDHGLPAEVLGLIEPHRKPCVG